LYLSIKSIADEQVQRTEKQTMLIRMPKVFHELTITMAGRLFSFVFIVETKFIHSL
jgi:hypothetical protein